MLSRGGIYAVKKRKKPVQKSPKPPPVDSVKSNPSKRHRDRLNYELDKLTNLLPFNDDVRARLDKLSVLRLSVGYLKAKSFFSARMKKNKAGWMPDKLDNFHENRQLSAQMNVPLFSEGELLLEALNGFILVVTAEGYVFYSSSTIQDYLGFHQSDVVHQSVYELIHTDDRPLFQRQLHWALNPPACQDPSPHTDSSSLCPNVITYEPHQLPPENSSFMERNFICRFRCLLDNSSGFLTLNFQGRLKFLHEQNRKAEDGTPIPPQLALFALASVLQPPSILEVRIKTLIFQTKHKLDFTPLACDTKGKFVLGYTETELCMRGTGYQFIHAADMMYCADNHVKMIKTGESGMTVFRLLTKQNSWVWVQANARLVYRGGRPDSIICKQRALTNEEGEEHLRKRLMGVSFSFATGEAVLYESHLLHLDPYLMKGNSAKFKKPKCVEQKNGVDPDSLLGALMTQNISAYASHQDPEFNVDSAFTDDFAILNVPGDFCRITNGAKNNSKHQEMLPGQDDPLATIMDMLSEKNIDEHDLCDTLQNLDVDVEQAELEQWEKALMKMDNSPPVPDDLNEIFTTDFILSCVEDMLSKDNLKANEFPHIGLDCTAGHVIEPAQQKTVRSIDRKPFGFNIQHPVISSSQGSMIAGVQNPVLAGTQNSVMAGTKNSVMAGVQNLVMAGVQNPIVGAQNPIMVGAQNPMIAGAQNPMIAGAQNPMMAGAQNTMMTGAQNPITVGAQNPMMVGAQNPMIAGAQNPMMAGAQNTTMTGAQNPIMVGAQNPMIAGAQNPMMVGAQNSMMAGAQNPVMVGAQNSMMAGAQNPVMVGIPNQVMTGTQNSQVPACQAAVLPNPQKALVSQPLYATSFGPLTARCSDQQNKIQSRNQNPLGSFPQTFSGMNLGSHLASDTLSPISYAPQKPCRTAALKMSNGRPVNMQQKHMGSVSPVQMLQRDLQQSLQQRREYLGVNGQQERCSVNSAALPPAQQQFSQGAMLQNEQQVSKQQEPMHHLLPQSSCSLVQDSTDKVSTATYLEQSLDWLHYSCNLAVDQRTSVNHLPVRTITSGSSSCMFASCEYQSCAPITRNGLLFPGIGSTVQEPPYSKVKISPNHSPLRPTCYYENEPANSLVGPSAMPNGERNTYQSSCQFEPSFIHLSENSVCEIPMRPASWNYNKQFKQGEALN
ncbi:uncharacterized protein LOC144595810 [Rhinoraja longicauda]